MITIDEVSSPDLAIPRERVWIDCAGFAAGEFDCIEDALRMVNAPLGAVLRRLADNEALFERAADGGWRTVDAKECA